MPLSRPIAPSQTQPTPLFHRICGRPSANERPTLPAGHKVTWGLLTDNTALDGSPYPFPVFDCDNS